MEARGALQSSSENESEEDDGRAQGHATASFLHEGDDDSHDGDNTWYGEDHTYHNHSLANVNATAHSARTRAEVSDEVRRLRRGFAAASGHGIVPDLDELRRVRCLKCDVLYPAINNVAIEHVCHGPGAKCGHCGLLHIKGGKYPHVCEVSDDGKITMVCRLCGWRRPREYAVAHRYRYRHTQQECDGRQRFGCGDVIRECVRCNGRYDIVRPGYPHVCDHLNHKVCPRCGWTQSKDSVARHFEQHTQADCDFRSWGPVATHPDPIISAKRGFTGHERAERATATGVSRSRRKGQPVRRAPRRVELVAATVNDINCLHGSDLRGAVNVYDAYLPAQFRRGHVHSTRHPLAVGQLPMSWGGVAARGRGATATTSCRLRYAIPRATPGAFRPHPAAATTRRLKMTTVKRSGTVGY